MNTKQITFAAAVELSKNIEADFAPFATLNAVGREKLQQFINDSAKTPDRHNIDAWAVDAENDACNLLSGGRAEIEMARFYTATGNPVTQQFESGDFDWLIQE